MKHHRSGSFFGAPADDFVVIIDEIANIRLSNFSKNNI
jgi:hypothetical protein